MKKSLGNLKHVSPREVWPSEAHDFTPWLSENIDMLGDVLGMDLEVTATEAPVGDFSVDIRARDLATGLEVVVENQYGATDHDHLGKLLTYASGVDARTLVWIAESVRDEHRQALEWLNERTDTDTAFFAITVEVLQIDESAPACNLKPVVFPNKWGKMVREKTAQTASPRMEAYRQFFQALTDELRDKHHYTGARVAFAQSWANYGSGLSGVPYGAAFSSGGRFRVEIYISQRDGEENKKLFDWLAERREKIETELGASLEWDRLDNRQASRIAVYRPGVIDAQEATLAELRSWAVVNLLAFKKIFGPLLKQYKQHRA